MKVIVLSGIQGCGVDDYARAAGAHLKSIGVPCVRIDTDKFLGEYKGVCSACALCEVRRNDLIHVKKCTLGPMAMGTDKLNTVTNRTARDIVLGADFVAGRRKAVIILEGVFTLGVEGYQALVGEKCWWFKTTNIPRCKKLYLQKIHAWRQPKGMMDAEYLAQADKVLNQLNWRQFAHQEDWAPDLRGFAPR